MDVSLFVTCLVDQFWPEVGTAASLVLRRAGCIVHFDARQTCCGQPAFNAGYRDEARAVARALLEIYGTRSDPIVVPSGSCGAMLRHLPELFRDDPGAFPRARSIAKRTHELGAFLVRILGVEDLGASFAGRVAWHDSCHARRWLGIEEEPRRLIARVAGAELVELPDREACCGFGGTFAVKHPEISVAMLDAKLAGLRAAGVDAVAGSDVSCLMQIGGRLARERSPIRVLHLAELLAGDGAAAAPGGPR
ncbi:MAG: (Fe-S)-binding protein [Planctomycetota bacterium]